MKQLSKYTTNTIAAITLGLSSIGLQAQEAPTPAAPQTPENPTPAPVVEAPVAIQPLKIGDSIPIDALSEVTWIQGDAVKSFNEEGKVYLLECWATWCGPCIQIIPHVNALHKKYESKGLVVIGMNIFEDGIENAQNFVKTQGDAMSYKVAYSGGRESKFADQVIKPADIQGIPHALVIKDGKLLLKLHPAELTEPLLNTILDNTFDADAYAKVKAEREKAREAQVILSQKASALFQASDWEGLKKLGQEVEYTNGMKFGLLTTAALKSENWTDVIGIRRDILAEKYGENIKVKLLDVIIAQDSAVSEGSALYAKEALVNYDAETSEMTPIGAVEYHFTKARFTFMTGDTEATKLELAKAVPVLEKIEEPNAKQALTKAITNATAKVAEGTFPTLRELLQTP